MQDNFADLLKSLGLQFKNLDLLTQAFIHRSYLNEIKLNMQSNERLEFLGDAILSFVVSDHLYRNRTADSEGDLTNLRAYIVKTKSLAQAAGKLHLGDYLRLSKGEDASGGRVNPQLLANTYEALLGAVFLDGGLDSVTKVIENTLLPLFEKEIKTGPPKDSKSLLQEVLQERFKQSPQYKTLQTFGPDHAKEFKVGAFLKGRRLGQGSGTSKQDAEEHAAKDALRALTSLNKDLL